MSPIHRLPWRTLALAAAALAVAASPAALGALALDRAIPLAGEPWRILTAHLVHLRGYHLAWNLLALVVLGLLFEHRLGRHFLPLALAGSVLIGSGLLLLEPGLDGYCGLSGVLNALFVGGALLESRAAAHRGQTAVAWLFRGAVLADLLKITVEAFAGAPLFTDPGALGGPPVPLAHALGALAGALVLLPPLRCGPEQTRPRGPAEGAAVVADRPGAPAPGQGQPAGSSLTRPVPSLRRPQVPPVAQASLRPRTR